MTTKQSKRIFGIGTVVIDHVVVLAEYPERDTKANIQAQWRQIGGPVPVALSTAARYGSQPTFLGRWGDDAAGQTISSGLTQRGIDIRPSRSHVDWSSGFAHVWTEEAEGSRTIAFSRGEFPLPTPAEIDAAQDTLAACQILHLDGWAADASLHAAKQMKGQGGAVVMDAGSKKPGMDALLPLVDVLIASNLFCRSWFGSEDVSMEQLRSLGCQTVIRTRGSDGATFWDGKQQVNVDAIEVVPVDTNGAGDIFAGAYLHAFANDWNVERSLRFANRVAGYACGFRGNSTWPTSEPHT